MNFVKKTILIFLLILGTVATNKAYSQPRPPTNPTGGPINGTAPIGDDLGILLLLSSVYSTYKFYKIKRTK